MGALRSRRWHEGNGEQSSARSSIQSTFILLHSIIHLFSPFTPGFALQFRVRAVNKEGESDPLETDKEILAKNPYETPGKVDKPEVTDWDKDHADLAWKPPADDGGAAIEEYIIEQKDKHGRWEPVSIAVLGILSQTSIPHFQVMTVPADQTQATVGNLKEGEEYQFRVVAKNKAGPGEPSDPSNKIIAKTRFCEYSI